VSADPPSNLALSKIGPDSDVVLRNLFEFYVHDMAEWFGIDIQPDGSYSYDTSRIWDNGWEAYLAKVGDLPAGFAVVGPAAEWPGGASGRDVREFFVLRRHRRHGLGRRMATLLWNELPGEWLVRVLEANASGIAFWRTTVADYSQGSYREEGRIHKERPWRFFRFASGGS
jgi:predicted acetyltransferase